MTRVQLGPPMQMLPVQTASPAQAPHSSEPPLQPLPILPQYWPPAGVQVVEGVHAASLLPPPSIVITGVPPAPVVPLVPAEPTLPADPTLPPAAVPPWLPALPDVDLTPAEQPSEAARATPSRQYKLGKLRMNGGTSLATVDGLRDMASTPCSVG